MTLAGDQPGRHHLDHPVSDDPAMSRALQKRVQHGQALVELALALPIFLLMLAGHLRLGLGVYTWNGLSQATREIARTTSVYPNVILGSSGRETRRTVATQLGLVPGMRGPRTGQLPVRRYHRHRQRPHPVRLGPVRPGDRHRDLLSRGALGPRWPDHDDLHQQHPDPLKGLP